MIALREPSLVRLWGIKGGAAGGGTCLKCSPMEDINSPHRGYARWLLQQIMLVSPFPTTIFIKEMLGIGPTSYHLETCVLTLMTVRFVM